VYCTVPPTILCNRQNSLFFNGDFIRQYRHGISQNCFIPSDTNFSNESLNKSPHLHQRPFFKKTLQYYQHDFRDGFRTLSGAAHHAAARAGVNNFTRTLALEWAPFNVRVNAIAPGYTETALPAKAWQEHPEDKEALLKLIPLGRTAQLEEMVSTAVFLASDASEYITGEIINVSGGLITTVSPRWIEYCREIREKK
jgi:NAD(P)-dependent dehydrogenase (short-subunit alcohol dehydrogenase family)